MDGRTKDIQYEVNELGCHICTSHAPYQNGYHYIKRNGKRYAIHRYIYENHYGEIPDGLVIRHKCDNTSCINPEHLEVGSQAENVKDMMDRGRNVFIPKNGETNPGSILTENDIRDIRADKTTSNTDLAKKYGVSDVNIYYIRNYKTWKHVV